MYGYYTLTLTRSTDITKFNARLLPDEQRALDFVNADLFVAKHAETLVWKPILDWIVAPPMRRTRPIVRAESNTTWKRDGWSNRPVPDAPPSHRKNFAYGRKS